MGSSSYFFRITFIFALSVVVFSSVSYGHVRRDEVLDKSNKSPFSKPILLKEGDSMNDVYQNLEEDQVVEWKEGIKLVGEWLMMTGLFGTENTRASQTTHQSEHFHYDFEEDKPIVSDGLVDKISMLKREEIVPLECSGRGKLVNKTGSVNKCKGNQCKIDSMTCDGVYYGGDSLYLYIGSLDHCKVNSILCEQLPRPRLEFFPLCDIQKFTCANNITKYPNEIGGGDVTACHVQVICPNADRSEFRFFGNEAFDFECSSDKLFCNGQEVSFEGNYISDNSSCEVRRLPCSDVAFSRPDNNQTSSTESCDRIGYTCGTDPLDNFCNTVEDNQITCPKGDTFHPYATIENITCEGETYHYPSWNGSIRNCESIRSIRFQNEVFRLPYSQSYCILSELDCNGIRTYWNFSDRIPPNCGVGRVICGDTFLWPPTSRCKRFEFGCKTSPSLCTYSKAELSCQSTCNQPGQVLGCDCPVDFKGKICETPRSTECSFNVTRSWIDNPGQGQVPYKWVKDCKGPKRFLGFPVCHAIKKSDKLVLSGNVQCHFPDGPIEELLRQSETKFEYRINGNDIRLSNQSVPTNWKLSVKPINFASFSDMRASKTLILDDEQMSGTKSVEFAINPTQIDPEFWVGGRLRVELKFLDTNSAPPSPVSKTIYGTMIDITDWRSNYPEQKYKVNGNVVAIVLLSLFAVAVLALYGYRYWSKIKSEKQGKSY